MKYLLYKNWKYDWIYTANLEQAKNFAKQFWYYIKYQVNWIIIDPLCLK